MVNITLVKRVKAEPKEDTSDNKDKNPRYGGKSTPYSRAEIVGAILWMSDQFGWSLEPSDMPRVDLARLFGVSTVTISRAFADIRKARDLATQIGNALVQERAEEYEEEGLNWD
jgi:hypothetical protein